MNVSSKVQVSCLNIQVYSSDYLSCLCFEEVCSIAFWLTKCQKSVRYHIQIEQILYIVFNLPQMLSTTTCLIQPEPYLFLHGGTYWIAGTQSVSSNPGGNYRQIHRDKEYRQRIGLKIYQHKHRLNFRLHVFFLTYFYVFLDVQSIFDVVFHIIR